jgi:hypothetical protein
MAPRLWRLGFIVGLVAAAGCSGDARDPTGLVPYDPGGGLTGGGGGGGGQNGGAPELVGSWRATFVFQLDTDVQVHTTTWTFSASGSCSRVSAVTSVLEDRTLTTSVSCTWRTNGTDIDIRFGGNVGTVTFRWGMDGFSPDRLMLDGVVYDRIA